MPRTSRSTLQREKHTRRLAPMSMKLLDYRTTHGGLTRARTSQKRRCGHGPARPSSPSCPGSPCLAHLQPEIGGAPLNLDGSAHLVKTGPHSFPGDAVWNIIRVRMSGAPPISGCKCARQGEPGHEGEDGRAGPCPQRGFCEVLARVRPPWVV